MNSKQDRPNLSTILFCDPVRPVPNDRCGLPSGAFRRRRGQFDGFRSVAICAGTDAKSGVAQPAHGNSPLSLAAAFGFAETQAAYAGPLRKRSDCTDLSALVGAGFRALLASGGVTKTAITVNATITQ